MRTDICRAALFVTLLVIIGGLAFAAGVAWSIRTVEAAETAGEKAGDRGTKKEPKVVYPKKTDLDFEGAEIQGELRSPGEFYFQRKTEEKFESLVKRRPNFHREMLRDVVVGK